MCWFVCVVVLLFCVLCGCDVCCVNLLMLSVCVCVLFWCRCGLCWMSGRFCVGVCLCVMVRLLLLGVM